MVDSTSCILVVMEAVVVDAVSWVLTHLDQGRGTLVEELEQAS